MKRYLLLGIILMFCIVSTSVFAVDITTCQELNTPSATYVLTADILNNADKICMNITATDVILDCNDYRINQTGAVIPGATGIMIEDTGTGATVKNCNISDWYSYGLYADETLDLTMYDNEFYDNTIQIYKTNNSSIYNNYMDATSELQGIVFQGSESNSMYNNTILSQKYLDAIHGIYVAQNSNYNNFTNNTINSSDDGIYVTVTSYYNRFVDNTIYDCTNSVWIKEVDDGSNIFTNLSVNGTEITFTGSEFKLHEVFDSERPTKAYGISYVNITNSSTTSWVYLNSTYDYNDRYFFDISLWKYNTSWFSETFNDNTVDKYIYKNITQFSIFGLFYAAEATMSNPVANISTGYSWDGLHFNSTLTSSNVTVYNITGIFNNIEYTPSNLGSGIYQTTTHLPMYSGSYEFYYTYNIFYDGIDYFYNTTRGSIDVSAIELNTTRGLPTLNFTYWKEEEPYTSINASHNLAITIWKSDSDSNATFNFSFAKNENHTISIYPVTADVYAFSIQEYENDGEPAISNITYPERNYYLNGLHLTNQSQEIKLYLLNSSYADVVGFNVLDNFGIGIDKVIIDAQRYYPGEDMYRTVARGYTDYSGSDSIRLFKCTGESQVYHKFLLFENYLPIGTFDKTCLIDDVYTFNIIDSVINQWGIYNDVTGGCEFFNTTQLLVCDYASLDGDSYFVELDVDEITITQSIDKCYSNVTATSGTLTCDLTGMTDEEYYYNFKATDTDGLYWSIDSGTVKNVAAGRFGQMGIFIAFMLVVALTFVGWQNPFVMMLLSIVGIAAGFFLGLYEVTGAGLISMIIAGAIIMYGSRGGSI